MDELAKVRRVMDRQVPGAPHEVLLVLDASTGQNAVRQAEAFTPAVDVTGLILTKLDGTAKGGIAIRISNEFKIPVKYIGVGEAWTTSRCSTAASSSRRCLGTGHGRVRHVQEPGQRAPFGR